VLAFGMQIYFNFSGYTDMAIGMAKLVRRRDRGASAGLRHCTGGALVRPRPVRGDRRLDSFHLLSIL